MNKPLALAAGILVSYAIVAIAPSQADADVMPPEVYEVLEDDTPPCIEMNDTGVRSFINITNRCDSDFEVQAVSCQACDTHLLIEAPQQEDDEAGDSSSAESEANSARLNLFDSVGVETEHRKTYEQHFTWTLAESSGNLRTEVTFHHSSQMSSPYEDSTCSSTGATLSTTLAVIIALLAILAFLRRGFTTTGRAIPMTR